MLGLDAHTAILVSTISFVGLCLVLVLCIVHRCSRRRRRLSKMLAAEGWVTAPSGSGWGWLPEDREPGNPSRISIKPKARLAELRLSIEGVSPLGLGWMVVPQRLISSSDRSWARGLPVQAHHLLRSGKARPCPGLPDYVVISEEGLLPPSNVTGLLAKLHAPNVGWVVWAWSSDAVVRRLGSRAHDAWPDLKQVGQALAASH